MIRLLEHIQEPDRRGACYIRRCRNGSQAALFRHLFDRAEFVTLRDMGVSLHHGQRFMA